MLRVLLMICFYLSKPALADEGIFLQPGSSALAKLLVKQLRSTSPDGEHKQEFLEAVKIYHSKDSHRSYRAFEEITEKAYDYEWSPMQRQSIAYSFLRLSEQYPEQSNFYLREAKKFADFDKLNLTAFAPTTGHRLKALRQELLEFPILHFFESAFYISVNGKQIPPKDWLKLALPAGKLRLVVISKRHQDFVFVGERDDLLKQKLQIKALDYGSCDFPLLPHPLLREKNFRMSYGDNCQYRVNAGVFVRETYHGPVVGPNLAVPRLVQPTPDTSKNKVPTKWYETNKLYYVLGTVAAALVFQHNHRVRKVVYQ